MALSTVRVQHRVLAYYTAVTSAYSARGGGVGWIKRTQCQFEYNVMTLYTTRTKAETCAAYCVCVQASSTPYAWGPPGGAVATRQGTLLKLGGQSRDKWDKRCFQLTKQALRW